VAGHDADALGKEAPSEPAPPAGAPAAAPGTLEAQVWDQLRTIFDPEIPVNIVDLGLIYACRLVPEEKGTRVEVEMSMTAPGCGMGTCSGSRRRRRSWVFPVARAGGRRVGSPWDQSRMSEAARLELGFG